MSKWAVVRLAAALGVWTLLVYSWGQYLWAVDVPDDRGAQLAADAGLVIGAIVWAMGAVGVVILWLMFGRR